MSSARRLDAALARLHGLSRYGVRLGLERVRRALHALGDPQASYPALHLAGTNGKGSTAAMLDSVLRAAGLRVGLYTSPHLCRFAERIRVDGREIPESRLADGVDRVLAADPELSFFEAATALGFLHFAEERVELAVVETGLGGRLDATNVLEHPLATILTRIDLDHQEQLGPDLASIAAEKAGILKPGVPAISAPASSPEVLSVLESRASEIGAPLRVLGRELRIGQGRGGTLRFESGRGVVEGIRLGLAGRHQEENAALALAALEEVVEAGHEVPRSALLEGLGSARWPGRLEWIGEDVLLDGAHNPNGARALAAALAASGRGPFALVLGLLGPKDPRAVLEPLLPHTSRLVATRPRSPRAIDPREIVEVAPASATVAPDLASALELARALRDPILVTGSLYLVGEARALLLGETLDPVALADPISAR